MISINNFSFLTLEIGKFIIKFASKEYLQDYLVHPIHVKIANEVIKPLANKITIYDTIIQE